MKPINLRDFLSKSPFEYEFPLTQCGNLSFHWSDWKEACLLLRDLVRVESDLCQKKEQLKEVEDMTKSEVFWVCHGDKRKKMTLHELYQLTIDPRMKEMVFKSKMEDILVSHEGKHGPYYSIKKMTWFNEHIYKAFLYNHLLTNKFVLRGFRIRTHFPIVIRVSHSEQLRLIVKQITPVGLLIEIENPQAFERLRRSNIQHEGLYVDFNLEFFKNMQKTALKTIVLKFENLNLMPLNILARGEKFFIGDSGISFEQSFFNKKEHYLFMEYESFRDADKAVRVCDVMNGFLENIKEHLDKDLFVDEAHTSKIDKQVA